MNRPAKTEYLRNAALFGLLILILLGIWGVMGGAYTLRMTVEATFYTILAFGLTIQLGLVGMYNAGVMGFVAIGAVMTLLVSFPVNREFWQSSCPEGLVRVVVTAVIGAGLVFAASRLDRFGVSRKLRNAVTLIVLAGAYMTFMHILAPVAAEIENGAGFVGGLGLPVWLGWLAGGALAGATGWLVGRICLGLRTDYLTIATVGIAEIIRAVVKNADWLTRGTLTVSPLPWPVPTPNDVGFVPARAGYLALMAGLVMVIYILLQRAYHAPWGRMMRAIRDNETAAAAMGKNVNRRRLEIFVFGCIIMGIGGAALITFERIFDPSSFQPINHTFLVWVVVILGGAGSNLGAVFGSFLVYIVWTMSEPAILLIFHLLERYGQSLLGLEFPDNFDTRALQMRVFVVGLVIVSVLRYAPRGLIPESVKSVE
ncbi:MAG: branched-chain amino acid ABC transporter permease [Hyphomicrobiales bacterium]